MWAISVFMPAGLTGFNPLNQSTDSTEMHYIIYVLSSHQYEGQLAELLCLPDIHLGYLTLHNGCGPPGSLVPSQLTYPCCYWDGQNGKATFPIGSQSPASQLLNGTECSVGWPCNREKTKNALHSTVDTRCNMVQCMQVLKQAHSSTDRFQMWCHADKMQLSFQAKQAGCNTGV